MFVCAKGCLGVRMLWFCVKTSLKMFLITVNCRMEREMHKDSTHPACIPHKITSCRWMRSKQQGWVSTQISFWFDSHSQALNSKLIHLYIYIRYRTYRSNIHNRKNLTKAVDYSVNTISWYMTIKGQNSLIITFSWLLMLGLTIKTIKLHRKHLNIYIYIYSFLYLILLFNFIFIITFKWWLW